MTDWNKRFLDLATLVSGWSKDPSTKCGCVIVNKNREVVSLGYNGFPRGVADDGRLDDRNEKYGIVLHAEENALLSARCDVSNCTAYVTLCPCSNCASRLIQAGIKTVIFYSPSLGRKERWGGSFDTSKKLFNEAKVAYMEFEPDVW